MEIPKSILDSTIRKLKQQDVRLSNFPVSDESDEMKVNGILFIFSLMHPIKNKRLKENRIEGKKLTSNELFNIEVKGVKKENRKNTIFFSN